MWFSVEVATEIIDSLMDTDLAVGRIEGAIIKADGEYHPLDLIREAEPEHLYQTWAEYKAAINAGARAFVTGYLRAAGELVTASFILDTVEDWRRERRHLFGKAAPEL